MNSNLYIPKKIKVGIQKRSDTFTGKLAFITYVDDKGLLRQENAWNGWRDKSIEPMDFDNIPQSNFVFNKDVNRNGYWSDTTKVRIYDTRDFEFEIDVSNMMYILMHSDISKRDIAEDCVLAWNGRNLVLLPVNSEEYQKSIENTRKLNSKFSTKNLIVGHSYLSKNLGDVVYLGFHEWSEDRYVGHTRMRQSVGKKHIFSVNQKYYEKFMALDGKDIVEQTSSDVHPDYASLIDSLFKSKGMIKCGSFSVKKGFEKIGYKKNGYEILKVIIDESSKNNPFILQKITLSVCNDIVKISKIEKLHYYEEHKYNNDMTDKKINLKDSQQIKSYFEEKGFGNLYYKNINGETIKID